MGNTPSHPLERELVYQDGGICTIFHHQTSLLQSSLWIRLFLKLQNFTTETGFDFNLLELMKKSSLKWGKIPKET